MSRVLAICLDGYEHCLAVEMMREGLMPARACGETLVSTLCKEPYAWVRKCYEVSVLAGRLREPGT